MMMEASKAIFAILSNFFILFFFTLSNGYFLVKINKKKLSTYTILKKKSLKINVTLFDGMVCYLVRIH